MGIALPIHESSDPRPAGARPITGPRQIHTVKTLRISVTDRCNFRCVYCMPEDAVEWVRRDHLLTFEEIVRVARAAIGWGIHAFKITGGEPLVRRDLPCLVAMLAALPGRPELSMTTNGVLLDRWAGDLKKAGLHRLTVSLDSLDEAKFREITRGADLQRVWRGIHAACDAGFKHPKINCVAMRGINDDEFGHFAALTRHTDLTVRFIEYMPIGTVSMGAPSEDRFISGEEIKRRITEQLGPLVPAERDGGHGPAVLHRLPGAAGRIGFITAMSQPFCDQCNRLRLTAEGRLRSCLFDGNEIELRPMLRAARTDPDPSASERSIHDALRRCATNKPDVHAMHGNRQMSQIGG